MYGEQRGLPMNREKNWGACMEGACVYVCMCVCEYMWRERHVSSSQFVGLLSFYLQTDHTNGFMMS